jgi:hypothetical protein
MKSAKKIFLFSRVSFTLIEYLMENTFFSNLADVRIFDDYNCRRAYGSVFDPNTEICAGDYNQRTDTMVCKNSSQINLFACFFN